MHKTHATLSSQIWTPQNGAHRQPFPAATPSWKLAPWPCSKHEKRTAGSAWETWIVAAADSVCCARVRWEINFLLTFETAPFICKHTVHLFIIIIVHLVTITFKCFLFRSCVQWLSRIYFGTQSFLLPASKPTHIIFSTLKKFVYLSKRKQLSIIGTLKLTS